MNEQSRSVDELILLVGSNPLPNYLAALVLKPRSIRLFHSKETESVKELLGKCLEDKFKASNVEVNSNLVSSSSTGEAQKIFSRFISSSAHLNYTGGTKVMAAQARMAFGMASKNASYLDDREGILRFDDGHEIPLAKAQIELTLDEILRLHGIEKISKAGQAVPLPTANDAERVAKAVLADPEKAKELYSFFQAPSNSRKRMSATDAQEKPLLIHDMLGVDLSVSQVPMPEWTSKTYEAWRKFLEGTWLEVLCGKLASDLVKEGCVSVGVQCRREMNKRQFELDVAVVCGHRLHVVSCTTADTIGPCKSKMFEVAMRARQMGGDLARSALVCLLHGRDQNGPFRDQLRNDVKDLWSAPNTPEVFGLDDLKEWLGIDGEPNLASLERWFDGKQ